MEFIDRIELEARRKRRISAPAMRRMAEQHAPRVSARVEGVRRQLTSV